MTMAGGPLGRTTRAGQEKENMADFIAKKREMFLVQMSLDTKREEIRKLEEKAQMKVSQPYLFLDKHMGTLAAPIMRSRCAAL